MEFAGSYLVPALPESVWLALNDPAILKSCIPGCDSLLRTDPIHFDVTATLKIGPVKATFRAKIEQTEIDPPRRCILKGEGQGGAAGFARGQAEVVLARENDGTRLSYTAKAAIGGKLAQIGQRLLDGAAKQIAEDFFSRFAAAVSASPTISPPEMAGPPPSQSDGTNSSTSDIPAGSSPPGRDGLAPEIWVVGLVGVIVILLVLFGIAL